MALPPSGSLHDGMPLPNPGASGNRDTYNPSQGSIASQAQHTADIERELSTRRKGLRGLIARVLGGLHRMVWGD
jgi:hypothetical protein